MRTPILALTVLLALFAMPLVPASGPVGAMATTISAVVHAQDAAPAPPSHVDVNINGPRGWHASPVWVAIGALALILLIVLIVVATRGGGGTTTVVR
jgi:hypothetical protein